MLPGLRVQTLPCSMAGILRTGGGVEPPHSLAAMNVVGIDEAANAIFGSCHPCNDLVLEGERRRRAAVAVAIILHLRVPENRAALHANRDDMGVERRLEEAVAHHRKASVDAPATGDDAAREIALVAPDLTARSRVNRPAE